MLGQCPYVVVHLAEKEFWRSQKLPNEPSSLKCKLVSVSVLARTVIDLDKSCRRKCSRCCLIIEKSLNGFNHMICPCLGLFCHGKKIELVRELMFNQCYKTSLQGMPSIMFCFLPNVVIESPIDLHHQQLLNKAAPGNEDLFFFLKYSN